MPLPAKLPAPTALLTTAACCLLAACGSDETSSQKAISEKASWPMARGGPQLRGFIPTNAPNPPTLEWSFPTESAITSGITVSEATAFFGNDNGTLHAVNLQARSHRWQLHTKDTIEATPAIAGGLVFAGSNDGTFRAIDAHSGTLKWSLESDEKFPTSAVILDNPKTAHKWVLINGYDGITRCLQQSSGEIVWTHETNDYINCAPAILANGLVAFGGCDAIVHMLRLADGSPHHTVQADAQIVRSLAAWEDTVYGVNHADQLFAANSTDEFILWAWSSEGNAFTCSPSVDTDHVYTATRDKHLHALDRKTGKPVWKYLASGRIAGAPLVFKDAVVFGASDGRLTAVDPKNGKEIWRLDLGEGLATPPAFADGRILLGGSDGTLFIVGGGPPP